MEPSLGLLLLQPSMEGDKRLPGVNDGKPTGASNGPERGEEGQKEFLHPCRELVLVHADGQGQG